LDKNLVLMCKIAVPTKHTGTRSVPVSTSQQLHYTFRL